MSNAEPRYEVPDRSTAADWEAKVNAAIANGALKWSQVDGSQWILSGNCPRCNHTTSQYVDFEVSVADVLDAVSFDETVMVKTETDGKQITSKRVSMEFACLCDETPPHKEKIKGCGAGRGGVVITIADPRS